MNESVDVLVVGAGPVGLLLATELQRDGVDVVLVERQTKRSFFCKALGVTPRTLEIFEDLGIAQDAIDAGLWLTGVTAFNDGALLHAMDVPSQGLPYGSLSLAQFETEKLLEASLRRHGGAVRYGWTLSAFAEDGEAVLAQLENTQGEKRALRCRWLVGCDGAHSIVRSELALGFSGGQYPQTFMLADLEVDWDLPRGRMYRFTVKAEDGTSISLAAVPVHGSSRRYRLSMILPQQAAHADRESATEQTPDLDRVSAVMIPLLPAGTKLSDMHWSSIYRVSHRIVPAYGRGRVFLAGDAAHIHPPVGGQGMNTGLQDAHNLAWKLVLASRNMASPTLLDSYSAERHPVGLDVVEQTSRALNKVIAAEVNVPGMRETQLLVGYPDSPIVRDDRHSAVEGAPSPGDRAPDAGGLRRAFVAHPLRLHERLGGGRHVLIGFLGESDKELETLSGLIGCLRAAFGRAASGFAIAGTERVRPDQETVPILIDADGEFATAYGARPGMAWLVRPDGHIGWCSAAPSRTALATYLAQIISGSLPNGQPMIGLCD